MKCCECLHYFGHTCNAELNRPLRRNPDDNACGRFVETNHPTTDTETFTESVEDKAMSNYVRMTLEAYDNMNRMADSGDMFAIQSRNELKKRSQEMRPEFNKLIDQLVSEGTVIIFKKGDEEYLALPEHDIINRD